MYSQFDEDIYIKNIINEQKLDIPAVFLDLGAFDGAFLSNSRFFLESGWRCHLVEPDKDNFAKLIENSLAFDNAECYNVGVGLKTKTAYLRKGGTGHPTQLAVTDSVTDNPVSIWSVKKLLAEIDEKEIGICSIDIEGHDTEVFNELCKHIRPIFVIIESHSKKARKDQLLIAIENGYHLINVLDFNMVFIRDDFARWIP